MTSQSQAILRERKIKLFFFLGALFLILLVLLLVPNMLVSFLLAFVTYYLLSPAVDFLERNGLSRLWATSVPFIALTVIIIAAGSLLIPLILDQARSLQENVHRYVETATQLMARIEAMTVDWSAFLGHNVLGELQPKITTWAAAEAKKLPDLLSKSMTVSILAPFLSFFMLLDGRDFVRKILRLVPNNLFELALELNHQIGSQIGGFIQARMIESIVIGVFVWIGLVMMDFPYALIWGISAGLLNVIPYLGPLLGALPAFLISLSNGVNSTELILLLVIFGGAQVIDSVILVPFLVAKIVNLHPVTVVLAVLIGSQLMGVLGMIICIPLISALKVTSIAIYRHVTLAKNSV